MKRDFKYVSLFSGMGGFDVALNNLGGECVMASEVDKWANKSYKHLYGFDTAGDVTKIKEEDVPDHDVMVGGFPCFEKGTLITTKEGLKKIEDVRKGDFVLTHTNTFKKVVKTMKRNKRGIYRLRVQGSPKTKITDEHPIYVREIHRKWDKEKRKTERWFSEPMWIEVRDLEKGKHLIGMSENEENYN